MIALLCKVVLLTICLGHFQLIEANLDLRSWRQYNTKDSSHVDFFHKELLYPTIVADLDFINVQFYVKGKSNAHILLAPSPDSADRSMNFEIVIGTDKNMFSLIRSGISHQMINQTITTEVISTPSVLDKFVMVPVRIQIVKDGRMKVYIGTKKKPILEYTDELLLDVKYVSFATLRPNRVSFLYGCHY